MGSEKLGVVWQSVLINFHAFDHSGAFNVDNAGSTLTGTSSRLHDNDLTGQLVLSGTENNIKGFNTFK